MNDHISSRERLEPEWRPFETWFTKVTTLSLTFGLTAVILFSGWKLYSYVESRIEERVRAENEVRLAAREMFPGCRGKATYSHMVYVDGRRLLQCWYD